MNVVPISFFVMGLFIFAKLYLDCILYTNVFRYYDSYFPSVFTNRRVTTNIIVYDKFKYLFSLFLRTEPIVIQNREVEHLFLSQRKQVTIYHNRFFHQQQKRWMRKTLRQRKQKNKTQHPLLQDPKCTLLFRELLFDLSSVKKP
jgi:hypothetical protein